MKYLGIFTLGFAFSASCSAAQQLPVRQPGLWEIVLGEQKTPQESPVTVRQCVDKASDAQILLSIAPGQENCGKTNVQRKGARYQIANRCMVHDQQVDMSMELTGDFKERYEGRYEVRYAKRQQVETRAFDARWVGGCSTGMQPGDMILPNGVSVNVLEKHKREHDKNHGHN